MTKAFEIFPLSGMSIQTMRRCPVCRGKTGRFLHRMDFILPEGSPLPPRYDLVICSQCETCFADSGATAEDYKVYYQSFSKYEDPRVATGGGDSPADQARLESLAKLIAVRFPPTTRVLDVGCGNGGLLAALHDQGFGELWGLDPSPLCIETVKAKGFEAQVATLPNLQIAWAKGAISFDLIVLNHVVEHVYDIGAAIQSLIPLLSGNPHFYIEVPDPGRYTINGFVPYYFFDSEHINHLNDDSLKRIAEENDIGCIEIGRREIRLQNGRDYPVIYGIFSSSPSSVILRNKNPQYEVLSAYIKSSEAAMGRIWSHLEPYVRSESARGVAIWGAGSLSQRIVASPAFPRSKLKAVVDRDRSKQGCRFGGLIVQSPEKGLARLGRDDVVVCMAAIAADEVLRDYQNMGLEFPFIRIDS